jgi:hypothetical protein
MYEHTSKPPQNKGLQTDCSLIQLKQVNHFCNLLTYCLAEGMSIIPQINPNLCSEQRILVYLFQFFFYGA